MRRISTIGAVAAVVCSTACGSGGTAPTGEVLGGGIARAPAADVDETPLVAGLNEFSFDLLPVVTEGAGDENVIFSPLSIAMAFGMAEAGAKGETADQIADVFHFPGTGPALHAAFNALDQNLTRTGRPTVRLANRMYPAVGYEVEEDFMRTLAASYGAPPERLDFASDPEQARKRINSWVAKRTADRLKELLGSGAVTRETRLVLVNALYLKADWAHWFGEEPTEPAPFTRLDGSTSEVPLMHIPSLETRYVDAGAYQAVELPYEGEQLSMLVLVPGEGGFADFEQGLDAKGVAAIDAAMTEGRVDLSLPRWSAESSIDLMQALGALGLSLPFGEGDFTGISSENPPIAAAVHMANIDVDEKGTVAAAATGLAFASSGPPPPDVVIRADRPFLYLIRDVETGTVLFLGRVVAP